MYMCLFVLHISIKLGLLCYHLIQEISPCSLVVRKNVSSQCVTISNALCVFLGEVGGWKNYFTVNQSERIDAIMKEKLKDTDIRIVDELK